MFQLENRIECQESGHVSYKNALDNMLLLCVPMDAAVNKDEVEVYKVSTDRFGLFHAAVEQFTVNSSIQMAFILEF